MYFEFSLDDYEWLYKNGFERSGDGIMERFQFRNSGSEVYVHLTVSDGTPDGFAVTILSRCVHSSVNFTRRFKDETAEKAVRDTVFLFELVSSEGVDMSKDLMEAFCQKEKKEPGNEI